MIVKESCRYVRSYSELEGLQRAHTLFYSARRTETGIVLELALEEGGVRSAHRVLCPSENFPRAMRLMKYLYENGVGAERTAIVMAKEGLNYANVLAPMAEERGTETIADTFGVMTAYNTDENFTYGSEEGSLKFVSNMEGNVYFGFRLKNLVRRIRPCDINDAIRLLIPYPSDYSFPSGHTAVSFAAASALYFAGEKYLWKAALVLAAFIAFSRMYLYVHYPTDILGGALLGILCGYLGCRIVQKTEQYKRKI